MTTRTAETRLKPKPDVLPVDQDAVDATLAAAGDTSAFERLYRKHVGRIHGLARRMLNDEEADDVTQAVFIRTWDKLDTFRGESAFGTWLHRLAVNVILARRSVLGTERRRMQGGEDMSESFAARPSRPDLSMDFEAAIGQLPEGARRVFVLHDVEGYKHEEIAEQLGIVAGTSKAQLHRARMALRQYLER